MNSCLPTATTYAHLVDLVDINKSFKASDSDYKQNVLKEQTSISSAVLVFLIGSFSAPIDQNNIIFNRAIL